MTAMPPFHFPYRIPHAQLLRSPFLHSLHFRFHSSLLFSPPHFIAPRSLSRSFLSPERHSLKIALRSGD
jgi:hypothetical protein